MLFEVVSARDLSNFSDHRIIRFINHDAMVPEVGEITLTDYLRENRNSLSHDKLLGISNDSLGCIVV